MTDHDLTDHDVTAATPSTAAAATESLGRPARIAFMGTPDVAVPALAHLHAQPDLDIVTVVTNPDRARGRSKRLVAPAVKDAAQQRGLTVLQPQRPREVLDQLQALRLDAVAVVAYGALLPDDVLAAGGRGYVNLHFSLLPRWRGAAPVQHALRAGDTTTGVTCFVLDAGMDTGPVLRTLETPIATDDDTGTLLERLAQLGAPVLADALRDLVAGVEPRPQPTDGATLAPKVTTADVELDWTARAGEVVDLVRSASPRPGAWTTLRGERAKVLAARVAADGDTLGAFAGDVLAPDAIEGADGPVVATGTGLVELRTVQPAGKKAMDGVAFLNGYQPVGERLGG